MESLPSASELTKKVFTLCDDPDKQDEAYKTLQDILHMEPSFLPAKVALICLPIPNEDDLYPKPKKISETDTELGILALTSSHAAKQDGAEFLKKICTAQSSSAFSHYICGRFHYAITHEFKVGRHYLHAAADLGNPMAALHYAYLLQNKDIHRAIHYYDVAAQQQIPEAMVKLGGIYYHGIGGTTTDNSLAFYWYLESTRFSPIDPFAAHALSQCYMFGLGTTYNLNEAIRYLKMAADLNLPEALTQYGDILLSGRCLVEKNIPLALQYFSTAQTIGINVDCYLAQAHFALHEFAIAFAYANKITPKELQNLLIHQRRDVHYILGCAYLDGAGTEKDVAKAVFHFQCSADEHKPDAYISLGYCYDCGIGVTANAVTSFEWYKKAAKAGDTVGYYNLGLRYLYGLGTEANPFYAVKYFRLAAKRNHTSAIIQLALCYQNGSGIRQNSQLAITNFRKASALGDIQADMYLSQY